MAQDLTWRDAIRTVLEAASEPMHYTEIAQQIVQRQLRKDPGATPANTVNVAIVDTFRKESDRSPFVRTEKGYYALRNQQLTSTSELVEREVTESEAESSDITGVINALGMFWERSKVLWQPQPRILGQQQSGTSEVDFCEQKGVYLLHDLQGVVYVGRVTSQGLGRRLWQHTADRLSGRWNRFSWFGVFPVREDGTLKKEADFSKINIDVVIATMEAVLIEGLEPRQNRHRGDDFKAVEFLQVEDPQLENERKRELFADLLKGLNPK